MPSKGRRGTSGKVCSTADRGFAYLAPRRGRGRQALLLHLGGGGRPPGPAHLGEEARAEDDPVHDDGGEEQLDVRGDDVASAPEQSPGAGGRLEREAAAD